MYLVNLNHADSRLFRTTDLFGPNFSSLKERLPRSKYQIRGRHDQFKASTTSYPSGLVRRDWDTIDALQKDIATELKYTGELTVFIYLIYVAYYYRSIAESRKEWLHPAIYWITH